jgi:hypothetical protein
VVLIAGGLLQSGGFFLHMMVGGPGRNSWGTRLTRAGAVVLTIAIAALAIGLARSAG